MTKTFIHPVSQLLYKVRHIEVKAKKGKCFNRVTQRQTSEKINNLIRNEVTLLVDVRYMGFVVHWPQLTTLQPPVFDHCVKGYSMAIAQTRQGPLTIAGAPRYQHRGVVLAVQPNGKYKMINPYDEQVCRLEMDRQSPELCELTIFFMIE